uniref:Uncharacterized protein n=1 Tax=Rhizophora mucronata TaxID=61149 RepID=A0A2P2KMC1_RHIMU
MATRILLPSTNGLSKLAPFVSHTRTQFISMKPSPLDHSHYRKQISLASLLRRYGFPPSQVHSLLHRSHFLLTANLHDIEESLVILSSFKMPQKAIVSLVTDCPAVLDTQFLKEWEVSFPRFGDFGNCPMLIKRVLEHSRKFQIGLDEFTKGFEVLKGLGFSEGAVKRVLESFPKIITMKERDIQQKVEFLMGVGMARDDVDWVFNSFPDVLGFQIESKLMPLLDEFEDLGFSKEVVRKEIIREPQILGMELGELSRCLEFLWTLKCREPIRLEIFGKGAFRAGFDVKLRVDCLCKHGLTRQEAFKVLWKEPRAIIYDIEDIEKKIEFLKVSMGFKVFDLAEVPKYLGVSFEKQIVPRYNVIEYLRTKGGLGDEVGLKSLIKLSRLRFYNLYVKPYPECEKIYGRFSGDVQVEGRHPTGLWKLLKPEKPPESKEDMKNMNSFMEGLV